MHSAPKTLPSDWLAALRAKLLGLALGRRAAYFRMWNESLRQEPALSWEERLLRIVEAFGPSPRRGLPPGIRFVSLLDREFPPVLRQLPQPPLGLFVEGQLSAGRRLSVVGSRRPHPYSLRLTRACVRVWVSQGCRIVSGGALGIDGEAHRAALDFGGKTWAILGGGHRQLHPKKHESLFAEILRSGGALLSEYPPWESPRKHYFPERNRLIAALGEELFLAQAHDRSGSLSTARTALELGREIWVLRPPLGDENFEGSARLIEAGARSLISPEELLRDSESLEPLF